MLTYDSIMSIQKEDLEEASKAFNQEDLAQLVDYLREKDDKIRYQALLLLQYRSKVMNDVYPFWDLFREKLTDSNSYQRSIGLTLIADNARWDTENKMEETIDDYLNLIHDEKPITVRQCIQALDKIISYQPQLNLKIARKLVKLNLSDIRESMRKLILMDILTILISIRKKEAFGLIDQYIFDALSGEILDKKAKKQMEAML